MGRAVFGVFLGIAIVVVAIVAVRRWAPSPGKNIEWVHSDASIIVQMKTSGPNDALGRSLSVPDFTLYGDGTLIARGAPPVAERPRLTSSAKRLYLAQLPDSEIENLLRFIGGKGFFDFSYSQPKPDVSGAGRYTTYMYVAARDRSNAVAAYAIEATAADDTELAEFRNLQTIMARLDEVVGNALGRPGAKPFVPQTGKLVMHSLGVPVRSDTAEWPHPQIDLGEPAPCTGAACADAVTERLLTANEVAMLDLPPPSVPQYQVADRLVEVFYRAVLPHEENFPELEPPQ